MTKTFDVITTVEVTIEDANLDTMLKDYRERINGTGTVNDMLEHIAWNEARWEGQFCEGCGENDKDFIATIIDSNVELF